MTFEDREYQQNAINSIQERAINLLSLPMRSGKSHVVQMAIEHYNWQKVLIVCGYRKIVTQFESYFKNDSTYILAGKDYNHNKKVTLASFQTYNRRDVDTSQYDCIVIDEYHSRMSKSVEDFISKATGTVLLLTGTPLTQSNRRITKGIDNWIQPITVKEMLEQGYLAPTRFMSNRNIIGENTGQLKTSRGDYSEVDVKAVVKKTDLLKDIENLIEKEHLATQHKTLVYVNFIDIAQELYGMLKDKYENIFVLHSKLSNKEQDFTLEKYQNCKTGVVISVRSLSLGFDSSTSDRLVFGLLTKIHSLALQILWRSSTLNPAEPNKEAIVYDMLGILSDVNPFTDFSEYSKKKTCKQECESIKDPFDRYFCHESCKGQPVMSICDGKLSPGLKENPHIIEYKCHGTPCKEAVPVHEMKFKSEDDGIGRIKKFSKCKCGCVSSYVLLTITQPSDMIEVYQDEIVRATATVLYDRIQKRAVVLLDDPTQTKYKVLEFTSSEDMYKTTLKYFKNKSFQIISNIAMPKLVNVKVNKALGVFLPLINWENQTQNGIVKKIIKFLLEEHVKITGLKKGFSYYFLKGITSNTEKEVMEFLNTEYLTKSQLIKMNNKLNPKS